MENKRLVVDPLVKAVNEDAREILHAISSDSSDRAGDVVVPSGARLENYMANPVVLVDHDYRVEKIIGKAVSVTVDDSKVYARTRFLDTPLAQDAFKLAKAGIGGWSIGFRPITYEPIEDKKGRTKGFRFTEWELLEYSAVAIPMNQEIVNQSIKRGLVREEFAPCFFKDWGQRPALSEPEPAMTRPPVHSIKLAAALRSVAARLDRFEAGQLIDEEMRHHGR